MICSCGHPMPCVDSRPYALSDPKIVRLRIYRCACGAEVATIEVRHDTSKIKRAITKVRRGRPRRRALAIGEV
jgi:hypothetical protein